MSSTILTVEQVSKAYPERPLFEGAHFGLEERQKVGVLGVNGAGKSTLLKIMAGMEPADEGQVVKRRDLRVAFLPQVPTFEAGATVMSAVFDAQDRRMRLLAEYEKACREMSPDLDRLTAAMEAEGVWELETRARTILTELGIEETERPVEQLSGGQQKLVALAGALVKNPDLLFLDEPTNHLDIGRIQWLERFLKRFTGTVVMVTHDRFFLERVCDRILEVEGQQVHSYQGNYQHYLERREQLQAQRDRESQRRESHLRRELAWLAQGPKARSTRQKARLHRAQELIEQGSGESGPGELQLQIGARRLGKKILTAHNLKARVIEDFDLELVRGERLGVVGPNGCGKTTILELLTGRLAPDAGRLEVGSTVHIGYFDQHTSTLKEEQRVIDAVEEIAAHLRLEEGRSISAGSLLERFLFPRSQHYTPVRKLSGGERRRLELLRVLMDRPNLLILDEPTNDLDVETLIRLESYLDDFPGCLIVVSHDRYLLDRVCTRLLVFEGHQPREYMGLLEELDFSAPRTQRETRAAAPVVAAAPTPPRRQKLSYKEKTELEALENEIAEGEDRVQELQRAMTEHADKASELNRYFQEFETLQRRLEEAMERWAELEEIRESSGG